MKRIPSSFFVATLVVFSIVVITPMHAAKKEVTKEFSVVFPKTFLGGNVRFKATSCLITLTDATPGSMSIEPNDKGVEPFAQIASDHEQIVTAVLQNGTKLYGPGRRQIFISRGSISPGEQLKFKAQLTSNTKPYVAEVEFVAFDDKGRFAGSVTLGNPDTVKKYVEGFTNHDYFDLSNPSNGVLTIINDAAGDSTDKLEYTIENLRVYTNLPESNYNLGNFENVGGASPVYLIPSLVVSSGQAIDIDLGQIGLPGQGYAVAIADKTTVRDLDTGFETASGVLALGADGTPGNAVTNFNVIIPPPTYDPSTQNWREAVTVTNVSGGSIVGPFTVVLDRLTSGVTLRNRTGYVDPDHPYIALSGIGALAANESTVVNLQFSNVPGATIDFIPQVFIGPFN